MDNPTLDYAAARRVPHFFARSRLRFRKLLSKKSISIFHLQILFSSSRIFELELA
jgi:hypothetical protein